MEEHENKVNELTPLDYKLMSMETVSDNELPRDVVNERAVPVIRDHMTDADRQLTKNLLFEMGRRS